MINRDTMELEYNGVTYLTQFYYEMSDSPWLNNGLNVSLLGVYDSYDEGETGDNLIDELTENELYEIKSIVEEILTDRFIDSGMIHVSDNYE